MALVQRSRCRFKNVTSMCEIPHKHKWTWQTDPGKLPLQMRITPHQSSDLRLLVPDMCKIYVKTACCASHKRITHVLSPFSVFGNKLRDHGALILLNGIAELQEQTARTAAAIQHAMLLPPGHDVLPQLPAGWSSFRVFTLSELDIGGNGLSSEGVKVLASYVRHHSYLQYLGLAQTSGADLSAWKELFDSLKENGSLTQIILDENNLGDPGVRLLADMLKDNRSLQEVDLDGNDITDVGGNDIMGALLCRMQFPLKHLSLEENSISTGLMSRIQKEVKWRLWERENTFTNHQNTWNIRNKAQTWKLTRCFVYILWSEENNLTHLTCFTFEHTHAL